MRLQNVRCEKGRRTRHIAWRADRIEEISASKGASRDAGCITGTRVVADGGLLGSYEAQ